MKKISLVLLSLAVLAGAVSCEKPDINHDGGKEIVLGFEGDGLVGVVDTKATAVTALPSSLKWGGTTGGNAAGTAAETVKWATTDGTVSSSKINTGKYQTATPTAYTYYVANQTFTAGGSMTVANNNTDIIAGRTAANSTATPSVTLNHIFARTGSLTTNITSGDGATLSNVSSKIIGKSTINGTAGPFDMKTQAWTAASTKLATATTLTGASDRYLIPGTYTIQVTATYTKDGYSKTSTKSCDVILVRNKINNMTFTWPANDGGGATQIVVSLSLTAWSNNAISANVS